MAPVSQAYPLVIVAGGGGQHANVVLEAAQVSGKTVAGVLDFTSRAQSFDDLLLLRGANLLSDVDFIRAHALVPAAGSYEFRVQVFQAVKRAGGTLGNVVHPTAIISPSASIGAGCVILAGTIIGTNATLGDLSIVNDAATVGHDAVLETGVNLCPGAHLAGSVKCGEAAFVGIGAVVIQGKSIGRRAVVGAGAVVINDVPDETTVVDIPAKPLVQQS